MGLIYHGAPTELILALKRESGIENFVETGTLVGDTAAWAANHFKRVVTIENEPERHKRASERFGETANIEVIFGESPSVLLMCFGLTTPAIFWLDAHWMGTGSGTGGGSRECPIMDEIAVINSGSANPHIILVDDARLFSAPPPHPHDAAQWPDLNTVVSALDFHGARYVVLFEDALIAVPQSMKPFLVKYLQERITGAWLVLNGLK
jgi:hypothetical protein